MSDILTKSSYELFKEITNMSDEEVIHMMLNSTLFIHPNSVKEIPVMYPDAARESNEFHKGVKKAQKTIWNGNEITIYDNSKARDAFGKYAKLKMGGNHRNVPKGLHVAHVWERVYDPEFFTAGWNICLMPDFLKIYTEKQAGTDHIANYLRQASYDIYFKNDLFDLKEGIEDPGLDILTLFPDWKPNFTDYKENEVVNIAYEGNMIPYEYARFTVNQSMYEKAVKEQRGVQIRIKPGNAAKNHPAGTYKVPFNVIKEFIELKQLDDNWKKNKNFNSVSIPNQLKDYFQED